MATQTPAEFLRKMSKAWDKKIKRDILHIIVAVEAEKMWAENFRKEGFTDRSFKPWPQRKKPETPKRALLVKTATLKGHALRGRKKENSVDFIFPLEYEKVHNEGLRAGRGQGFQMPKRQYIGDSHRLKMRIDRKVQEYLTNLLKKP